MYVFFPTDLCIIRSKPGGDQCPKKNDGLPGEKCVAKYLTSEACKNAGGKWTRFITNVMERTRGVLSTCHGVDGMKLQRGVPYEPHEVAQGGDLLEQYCDLGYSIRHLSSIEPGVSLQF